MLHAVDANLVLMGLRGSGKSTVGLRLAESMSRPFIDLDNETARAMGHPTAGEAFRTAGEGSFRLVEAASLARVAGSRRQVIALGGGTPTARGAADFLQLCRAAGTSWLVYLHAPVVALRERLAATDLSSRPALLGADPLFEIEQVYAMRDGLYRTLADVVVEAGSRTSEQVAAEVLAAWNRP